MLISLTFTHTFLDTSMSYCFKSIRNSREIESWAATFARFNLTLAKICNLQVWVRLISRSKTYARACPIGSSIASGCHTSERTATQDWNTMGQQLYIKPVVTGIQSATELEDCMVWFALHEFLLWYRVIWWLQRSDHRCASSAPFKQGVTRALSSCGKKGLTVLH